jgi:mono/diheme cytochrome c family protein
VSSHRRHRGAPHVRTARLAVSTALLAILAPSAGCIGETSEEPPIVPIRNMYDQPRYDPQERSSFFEDHRTMRPPVPGTIAVEMDSSLSHHSGRTEDDSAWLLTIPPEIIERRGGMASFITHGQERYGIYCAPCHGLSGDGQGPVAARIVTLAEGADPGSGVLQPPTFHTDALRQIPDGQLYATITNGIRNMPAYRQSVPQDDRWSIVAYVRALQISQATARTAMNIEGPGAAAARANNVEQNP